MCRRQSNWLATRCTPRPSSVGGGWQWTVLRRLSPMPLRTIVATLTSSRKWVGLLFQCLVIISFTIRLFWSLVIISFGIRLFWSACIHQPSTEPHILNLIEHILINVGCDTSFFNCAFTRGENNESPGDLFYVPPTHYTFAVVGCNPIVWMLAANLCIQSCGWCLCPRLEVSQASDLHKCIGYTTSVSKLTN